MYPNDSAAEVTGPFVVSLAERFDDVGIRSPQSADFVWVGSVLRHFEVEKETCHAPARAILGSAGRVRLGWRTALPGRLDTLLLWLWLPPGFGTLSVRQGCRLRGSVLLLLSLFRF